MTVCIAAVCNFIPDQLPVVICASDRMITIDDLEYEPEQTKIIYMASQTVGLFAGDMQLHAAVVPSHLLRHGIFWSNWHRRTACIVSIHARKI